LVRLTLDYETYFDSKDYSLRKMTMREYIMDPRFEAQCLGAVVDGKPRIVIEHNDIAKWLSQWDWDDVTLCAHNCVFDGAITAWRFGHYPAVYECTRFMSQAIVAHITGSAALANVSALLNMNKDSEALANMDGVTVAAMDRECADYKRWLAYAASDAAQCEIIRSWASRKVSAEERRVIHILVKMYVESTLELDDPLLEINLVKAVSDRERLFAAVGVEDPKAITGRDSFADLLVAQGIEPPTKISPSTGKSTWAFSKKDLDFVALLHHPNPDVAALVECRMNAASSLEETRTKRFRTLASYNPPTLNVPLLYSGAHTHRFSGMDSLNLQNLPRGSLLRRAIIAPAGYKLVVIDAAQIEARILAWLAGQMDLVEAFAAGEDVYSSFASKIVGFEVNKKDHPDERFMGKTGILGLGYNAGWSKFHWMCASKGKPVSEEFAKNVVTTYRTGYDKIPRYWRVAQGAITSLMRGTSLTLGPVTCRHKRVCLPSGLDIVYPKLERFSGVGDDGRVERGFRYYKAGKRMWTNLYGGKLVENIVQALARLQITDTMLKMDAEHPEWFCALQVHDELVYIAPESEAEFCYDELHTAMCAQPKWARVKPYDIPLAAEGGIGDRYGDIK